MAPCTEMESPMQLVKNSTDGKLTVCKDAVDVIKTIDQPLVVVAMVGKYRTGKSYLLNRLAGKKDGFSTASNVQSQTKGIWIWCFPHPEQDDHCMVLLDTEGLGDVEKGDEGNDTKLFALAVLLSSMFVYNSRGTIDQQALQDINFVTELTKIIRTNSKIEDDHGEDFMKYFPGFVWTVRDFTLQLKYFGKQITPNEYLETALELKKGSDEKVQRFNLPRQCIRYYFPSRHCFVFDCPGNKHVLQNIETVDDSKLEPDFVKSCNEFCDFIYKKAEKKTVPGSGGKMVTGAMFTHLLNTYVEVLSSGKLAFLDKIIQSLAETENEKAVEKAIKHYEAEMKQLVTLPTETAVELNEIHEKCNRETMDIFLKCSLGEREKYKEQLEDKIAGTFEDYCKRNEKESENKCKDLLKKLFGEIDTKFQGNVYAKPGGYIDYMTDRCHAENSYNLESKKGVKAKEILKEFLNQKMTEIECIRMLDQSLTEQERKQEAEKDKQTLMELQKAAMELQMQMMKENMETMTKSNNDNMKRFMEMMRVEREEERKEAERIAELKNQELRSIMAENSKPFCVIS
ncbi:guanylate-binding protein 2-like [Heterodontus francisci]|uniref:guanylate-binding protein 2-like n=1 Tax=Heterodontus francisci TaxID=7792 RepID=UPI00355C6649